MSASENSQVHPNSAESENSSQILAGDERPHLLIVEDEPTIRELFATLLTAAGYSVAEAQDGFTALEEIRRRRPALILSDLNMPRMTGFELLSVIRRRFPSIRVIAMSGAFQGDSVPDGVSADAFYEKSGRHISTLVDVIEDMLANPEVDGKREHPANFQTVALWVTRRGTALDTPYTLLICHECLRSFPYAIEGQTTMEVQSTPCIFCSAEISFALLDPSVSHHPGYAPSEPR